ncbi:MAG: hypothetical protein V1492_00125 [Candidatus Micrarchaeota archaeon]
MSNVTLYVPDDVRDAMAVHEDIRWSEVARKAILEKLKELKKLELLKKYVERMPLTEADWEWMDENDWHPVDEKDMKLSFIKEVEKRSKEKPIRVRKAADLFK